MKPFKDNLWKDLAMKNCPKCDNFPSLFNYKDNYYQVKCIKCHLQTPKFQEKTQAVKTWNDI